jgi:CMP-N-acetylneuraminic acid synthetase
MALPDGNNPYVVALVPVKISSRRIPGKNIVRILGQELFVFSIQAGIQASRIAEVFVSSESSNVLESACRLGAKPILRPMALSAPDVTNQAVIEHALNEVHRLRGRRPDLLVLLQPTHPFRCPCDIDAAIKALLDNPEADSVFALRRLDELTGIMLDDRFMPDASLPRNRAAEQQRYVNTGSFYVLRVSQTVDHGSFFGAVIRGFVLTRPEMEIDIDHPEQLAMGRAIAELFYEDLLSYRLIAQKAE